MVLIPLKSQYVSLIISFFSLFAELALLHATLKFNGYFECRGLRKGNEVSVSRHQRRVGVFSVLALLAFLALEIITSFFSDPAVRKALVDQPCVAVDGLDRRDGSNGIRIEEDFVSLKCNNFRDQSILYRAGNYSFEEERVRCSPTDLLELKTEPVSEYLLDGARRLSAEEPNPNPLLHCTDGLCVVVETGTPSLMESQNGTLLKISQIFKESNLEALRESRPPMRYIETIVFFDFSGLQPVFAERALDPNSRRVQDPMEWVRRIYLGSETTVCPFDKNIGDATSIPLALVIVVSAIWLLSFLTCISSLVIRASIFYDISNPIHWAKHTRHKVDEMIKGDPVISTIDEGGRRVVQVSESQRK